MWETFTEWFMSLCDKDAVNPIMCGSIYGGAIPVLKVSAAWPA